MKQLMLTQLPNVFKWSWPKSPRGEKKENCLKKITNVIDYILVMFIFCHFSGT